jgi:hypothetical protein
MSASSIQTMTGALTAPYRRGAETSQLSLRAEENGRALFEPYGFEEYEARYGAPPAEPRYILHAHAGVGAEALTIEVEYTYGGVTGTASVSIPQGAPAGSSFSIPTPRGADSTLRLTSLRVLPAPSGEEWTAAWSVTALLGNLAKLAWVLGWEKDQLRRGMEAIAGERHVEAASGHSLDLLGEGLRITRFPARPYSFAADTIALYHFDEEVSDGARVTDAMGHFGRPGHMAIARGTLRSAPGKFGRGFRFPGQSGAGFVQVPAHSDFDIEASAGFTIEAFVRCDGVAAGTEAAPRALVLKSAGDDVRLETGPGWALAVGEFRGIANNLRWAVADDGGHRVEVFADLDLADKRFHHVAGTIDRARGVARLFVDGEERARAPLGALGRVAGGGGVFIGGTDSSQFGGVIDEVRFSSVARESFHPVLGEGDEEYRRRLAVFTRWQTPNPAALVEAINQLVVVGGVTPSFVVAEEDNRMALAHRKIRVLPHELQRGATISAAGDPRTTEAQSAGSPEDEPEFDPAWLVFHEDSRAVYADGTNAHRMQRGTAATLDNLLSRLERLGEGAGGKLSVQRAYDPTAIGLHRVGRALLLTHTAPTLGPARLAAHAHAAGFDYVSHERSGMVRVAVRKSELLGITLAPEPTTDLPFLREGEEYDLGVQPAPPAGARVRWTVVRGGAGDGEVETDGGLARFRALAAGQVLLRVEATLGRQTVRGSLYVRIAPAGLAVGEAIGGDGRRDVSEDEVSGPPSPDFDARYLIHAWDDERVDYGTNPRNRHMQLELARTLERLLSLLPQGGRLRIEKGYVPSEGGLHGQGRALLLTHPSLSPEQLAPLAYAAGFDFIRHVPSPRALYVSIAQGALVSVEGPEEVEVGASLTLALAPETLPVGGETGELVEWAAIPLPRGRVELAEPDAAEPTTPHGREVVVTGREPGTVAVRAMYLHVGRTDPYQFELRLVPELDHDATFIAKDQYDIIINLLNVLHPVGVKVLTEKIRRRVVEVWEGHLDAFPGYTYPMF